MIQGFTVILLAAAVWLILKGTVTLLRALGEGAKRLRLVALVVLAIPVGTVWFMMVGPIGFGVTLVALGAAAWVVRGYRRP